MNLILFQLMWKLLHEVKVNENVILSKSQGRSPLSVVINLQDCDIVVSDFELQSPFYGLDSTTIVLQW